ncbi:hypothetical protein [Natrinema hispanicum]|uniref:Uncharacterized protein n=1 Tax=Natrinema hispanicum TaxID=392421 RepID=A0A1I0DLZ3_9EURY|nr:hypothetical protein [Natrinema hispanicum]SDC83735.1 hypothetical protein SAMN05192552_100814 [Natrinema hispanicum]SET33528.1 hypothetical protein SAMN04488694_105218 [Natrinema hispanicum]
MDRRTFVTTTGLGMGFAGCLTTARNESGGETEPSNETEPMDSENDSVTSSDAETDTDSSDQTVTTDETHRDVTFDSCERARVSGTFEAGDVAFANTGFYQDGLYGDTRLEDGVVFGEDVDAPFSGTVIFEIADGSHIRERDGEIIVAISDYGGDGTVISSLTTRQADYERVVPTHENPDTSDCLGDLTPDDHSDASG